MKKIFTLILMLATVATFAQSLSVTYEGSPVNDGDTLEMLIPQLNVNNNYYLDITNVTDHVVRVIVYKNELEMVEGAEASICVGGICFPPTMMASEPFEIEAGATLSHVNTSNAFHMEYVTFANGTSYVKITFTNYENSDDCVNVIFKLVSNPSNIEPVSYVGKLRAYPNPASDNVTVEYAVSGNASKVQMVIKNLLGATIYTRNLDVNANKVKVDVSEYPAGIYFYSIEADGRPVVTKKLLVK